MGPDCMRFRDLQGFAYIHMAFVRLLALFGAISCSAAKQWCARGDACWPTSDDITALKAALDPAAPRVLKWNGTGTPRPSSVPIGSPGDQPLYSFGAQGLAALYVNDTLDDPSSCMQPGEKRAVCIAATRNTPLTPNSPQFVVYPLTVAHVQAAVKFAAKHNL